MPKVIRVGQPVCKIKHVLQKSVILDESSTFEPEKKLEEIGHASYMSRSPRHVYLPWFMIQWLTPLNLYFLLLGSSLKLPSLSTVHIGWLQRWDAYGVEYSCLRTKMYRWAPLLPVSHICICVSCLWSSRFYGTSPEETLGITNSDHWCLFILSSL